MVSPSLSILGGTWCFFLRMTSIFVKKKVFFGRGGADFGELLLQRGFEKFPLLQGILCPQYEAVSGWCDFFIHCLLSNVGRRFPSIAMVLLSFLIVHNLVLYFSDIWRNPWNLLWGDPKSWENLQILWPWMTWRGYHHTYNWKLVFIRKPLALHPTAFSLIYCSGSWRLSWNTFR